MTTHRAELLKLREALAAMRAVTPELHRARHAEARMIARPEARELKRERPVCGAKRRDGGTCCARVVWVAGEESPRRRCRLHGGLSTGPRTSAGAARARANLRRGRAPGTPPGAGAGAGAGAAERAAQAPPIGAIWHRAREAVTVDAGRVRFVAVDTCASCTVAARRTRGVAGWFVRRCKAGGVSPADFRRVVRWTRCAEHAAAVLAVWERLGGRGWSLEFSTPAA